MRIISAIAFLQILTVRVEYNEGKDYAVLSPSCRMLDLDPLDESIVKFVEKLNSTSCATKPPLTSVSQAGRSHVLHLHEENFHHYISNDSPIECMYDLIRRRGPHESYFTDIEYSYKIESHLPLNGDMTFIEDAEFVRVQCFLEEANLEPIYINMHAFVGYKEEVGRKINRNIDNPSESRKMGVMIVGFDSMSRSNIQRNMPKTVQHLTRTGWYSLRGYNKIEDNTFPNVMAILTGKSLEQLKRTCWPSQFERLDNCPMIWKNFSTKGYITAYAEDSPFMGTFNSAKMGFETPPTDYYMRPFLLAADKFISNGNGPCLGMAKTAHHIFNYSIDFAECFHRHPTFSLFWLNSFSHNDGNEPSTMDDDVASYFKRLGDTGILSTTIVIFLSDHGLRVGSLRETYVGHIEDRQPFIYLWVPKMYKKTYPEKLRHLLVNTNKLTSPYDIHMTLVDILGENTKAEGCPGCRSLFKRIPWNRSCADAGITEHWCTCNEYEDIPFNTHWAVGLAESVVAKINEILSYYDDCAELELLKILSLRKKTFGVSPSESYIVTFQTTPGNGKFEATAARIGNTKDGDNQETKWQIFETVSRINLYGNQSYCTFDYFAKEYCFCPDYLTKYPPTPKYDENILLPY